MAAGKLVDKWYYEYKGIAQPDEPAEDGEDSQPKPKYVKDIKVEIQLRMHKKFEDNDTPPLEVKDVYFTVECPEAKIKLEGTDIECLRAAMWEKLDERFKIKWEWFLLVRIEPTSHYGSGRAEGLQLVYEDVEKGTAWDGTLLLRQDRWRSRYEEAIIKPWPGEFTDRQGRVQACIPKTDANKEALEEFQRKIIELRKALAKFVKPEVIMKTLANMSSMALLSAPDEGREVEDKAENEIVEVELENVE